MLPISEDFVLDAICLAAFSNNNETMQLLSSILETYDISKEKAPASIDEDYEIFFDIIRDIVELGVDLDKKAEVSRILLKVKKSPLGEKNPDLVDQIANIFKNSDDVSEQRIATLFKKLQNWVVMSKTSDMLRKMLARCNRYDPVNETMNDVILTEVSEHAREIANMHEKMFSTSTTIDMVDFSNTASITKSVKSYHNKRAKNTFPTGLMALNRLLGPEGGFVRGESWIFAASSHNYKTGMLMSCADWCCTRATVTVPTGTTPCVLFISLENEVPENTMEMVRRAYVTAYRQPPPKDMSNEDMIEIVRQHYSKRGIRLLMYRFDEYFGFKDFVNLIGKLRMQGLTVVAAILDYVGITYIEERPHNTKNAAQMKQENVKHFCNFCKRNDILFITGWQLGTEADMLNSSSNTHVVRKYTVACLGDCRGVRREIDGLVFMYIEKNHLGVPYLTMAWSKHRDTVPPSKEDQYPAWRFAGETLGIMDDIDTGVDSVVRDIYADEGGIDDEDEQETTSDVTNLFSDVLSCNSK